MRRFFAHPVSQRTPAESSELHRILSNQQFLLSVRRSTLRQEGDQRALSHIVDFDVRISLTTPAEHIIESLCVSGRYWLRQFYRLMMRIISRGSVMHRE